EALRVAPAAVDDGEAARGLAVDLFGEVDYLIGALEEEALILATLDREALRLDVVVDHQRAARVEAPRLLRRGAELRDPGHLERLRDLPLEVREELARHGGRREELRGRAAGRAARPLDDRADLVRDHAAAHFGGRVHEDARHGHQPDALLDALERPVDAALQEVDLLDKPRSPEADLGVTPAVEHEGEAVARPLDVTEHNTIDRDDVTAVTRLGATRQVPRLDNADRLGERAHDAVHVGIA